MAEEIGGVYNTKIPEYADNADIQEAFKLFLYGTTNIPTDLNSVVSPSLAAHLKTLRNSITELEDTGIGSEFVATEPESPVDGFIWVDSDASLATEYSIPSVIYQNNEPTTNLSSGMLWVDKDSSPLTMYVYDEDLGWREVGA